MSKQSTPPAVGGSSLLVIFAVLCLTVFAVLGLSTVQADKRMAQAAKEAIQNYYMADAKAEQILAMLRQKTVPSGIVVEDDVYSYQCRVSEVQALSVKVRITEENYEILCWKLISTTEWEENESLDVWSGNFK